nr:hypothetical protein GCM10020063_090030 [Dactylosporangium thailandense]
MPLTERLDEWRAWLARLGAPVAPVLRSGASPGRIAQTLGPDVPSAVVEWFQWCDGVDATPGQTIGDSWTVPGFWPVELDEVARLKRIYDDPDDPLLAGAWVPLLMDGGTFLYGAAWSPGGPPAVACVMPEDGPAELEFDTIEQMVEFFCACFAGSAYVLDDDGILDCVQDRYDEIYAAIVGRQPS